MTNDDRIRIKIQIGQWEKIVCINKRLERNKQPTRKLQFSSNKHSHTAIVIGKRKLFENYNIL